VTGLAIKVCGVMEPAEVELLASTGVDLVGLWWGVPGGRADLTTPRLNELARHARASARSDPVMVTFSDRATEVVTTLEGAGIRLVQLHGYQRPTVVAQLRALAARPLQVLKVLHIKNGVCVERRFIRHYERAGVDVFLIDMVARDGQVGSTGLELDPDAALEVFDACERPVMLAGGLCAENADRFAGLRRHERFAGSDFDTHARHPDGRLDGTRIARIVSAWR
jgi:phosphoribosylanthranilate isomerase